MPTAGFINAVTAECRPGSALSPTVDLRVSN